ncbi:MAG TPA: MlaD family protein [Burkholderiales bacterium]|nr:MlaD family protein [Burkholderiales bacterium]
MESDKHYFIEGLFVIGFMIAAAIFSVWLVRTGHRDDVLYRIHFAESVSGLALGDSVKYHGVDVGTVKSMSLDAEDPRKVQVDVSLRKDAPVKTDTKAGLKLKGITGGVYIELDGGSAKAQTLLAATPAGAVPEIPSQKSQLTTVLEQLPGVIKRFSALEDQGKKVMSDVSEVTEKITEHPLMRFGRKKDKTAPQDK